MMPDIRLCTYSAVRVLVALLVTAIAGAAQIPNRSGMRDPYRNPHPLARLVLGSRDEMLTETEYTVWDSSAQVLRGQFSALCHYPQLIAAGYRSFRTESHKYSIFPGEDAATTSLAIDQASATHEEDGNVTTTFIYSYDSSGWLRMIRQTTLDPKRDGYLESRDSFSYRFKQGRPVTFFMHRRTTSRSSYVPAKCALPTGSRRTTELFQLVAELDTMERILDLTHSRERIYGDTCRPDPPQNGHRKMVYDERGRLESAVYLNERDSILSQTRIRYEKQSSGGVGQGDPEQIEASRFLDDNALSRWLKEQQVSFQTPTKVISQTGGYSQSDYHLADPQGRAVLSWSGVRSASDAIKIYSYQDSANRGGRYHFERNQLLINRRAITGSDWRPGVYAIRTRYIFSEKLWDKSGLLQRVYGEEQGCGDVCPRPELGRISKPQAPYQSPHDRYVDHWQYRSAAWTDNRGLLLYLWNKEFVTRLIYE